jgi:hypothetical protein
MCPVCDMEYNEPFFVCPACSFESACDATILWANKEDAVNWFDRTVKPFRRYWELRLYQNEMIKMISNIEMSYKQSLGQTKSAILLSFKEQESKLEYLQLKLNGYAGKSNNDSNKAIVSSVGNIKTDNSQSLHKSKLIAHKGDVEKIKVKTPIPTKMIEYIFGDYGMNLSNHLQNKLRIPVLAQISSVENIM